jgi:hypothetical protein
VTVLQLPTRIPALVASGAMAAIPLTFAVVLFIAFSPRLAAQSAAVDHRVDITYRLDDGCELSIDGDAESLSGERYDAVIAFIDAEIIRRPPPRVLSEADGRQWSGPGASDGRRWVRVRANDIIGVVCLFDEDGRFAGSQFARQDGDRIVLRDADRPLSTLPPQHHRVTIRLRDDDTLHAGGRRVVSAARQ